LEASLLDQEKDSFSIGIEVGEGLRVDGGEEFGVDVCPQATVSNRSIVEKRINLTLFIVFPLESKLSRKASLVYSSSFARIAL
jgi:hypothetical protein